MRVLFFIMCCFVTFIFTGCSMKDLSAEGSNVEVVHALPSKNCVNLGPVFAKGGGAIGGNWLPDEALMEYAVNDLRNKAAAKGATHVVIQGHQMGHSGGGYKGAGGSTSTATFTGIAYKCKK